MYPFDTPLVIFLINILFLGLCLHKDMTKITNKQIKENKKKSFYYFATYLLKNSKLKTKSYLFRLLAVKRL